MNRDNLTEEQQAVFDTLSADDKHGYLVVADTSKCVSVRIVIADKLPKVALESINNGVARAVLKSGGGK